MNTLDAVLTTFGLVYGVFLIICAFVSNRLTDALRLDALFIPRPTPQTRLLNIVFGLAALGYYGYSLLKALHFI